MLKTALLTFLAVAVAIGLGGGSVWYALDAQAGVGAIRAGPWTAFPDIGTAAADPYTQARTAREGVLTLGRAEGLAFVAGSDSGGAPLRRECVYRLEGGFPIARFFTLYAADGSLDAIDTGKRRRAALQSMQILRRPDDTAVISTGSHPLPGNWLAVTGKGPLYFVLTFYDTPIATSTGLSDIEMPAIRKVGCHA
ncbi:DUF1214 domain-containing protein [Mesorhizobium sp. CN5-321]|jgi:hypothetical protein|uniref:DUF1214 domain-containing protein n=1 Tax=Mesorhizobium hunchu TaxID=3157708 RepID=UPI0032B85A0E